jgi:exopolysaccharide biosynthesis WecB/TagA/CpsF family protein
VTILGTRVSRLGRQEALARIDALLGESGPSLVAFANAHTLNLAYSEPAFRDVLQRASLVLNDGIGVTIAGLLLGTPFGDNLNGSDLMPEVLKLAAARRGRVYLLGGRPGVAARAAERLQTSITGLDICGTRDGFFEAEESAAVAATIRAARTDVVVAAMGNPRQELWLSKHLEETGASVGVGVGAFLDFAAGMVRRAPPWANRLGFEWLFRLAQEPRRLGARYLLGNPVFLARIARQAMCREHVSGGAGDA